MRFLNPFSQIKKCYVGQMMKHFWVVATFDYIHTHTYTNLFIYLLINLYPVNVVHNNTVLQCKIRFFRHKSLYRCAVWIVHSISNVQNISKHIKSESARSGRGNSHKGNYFAMSSGFPDKFWAPLVITHHREEASCGSLSNLDHRTCIIHAIWW